MHISESPSCDNIYNKCLGREMGTERAFCSPRDLGVIPAIPLSVEVIALCPRASCLPTLSLVPYQYKST